MYDNLSRGNEIRNYKSWLYKVVLNYNNKAVKDEIKRNKIDFLDNEEKDQVLNNRLSCEPDFVENMVGDKTIEERMMIILSSLIKDEQYLYFAHYHENDFQSIEALNIYNIISELDLNTDAQETICILKNIIEINDYVEEEKIADATAGFNMFDHIGGLFSEELSLMVEFSLYGGQEFIGTILHHLLNPISVLRLLKK